MHLYIHGKKSIKQNGKLHTANIALKKQITATSQKQKASKIFWLKKVKNVIEVKYSEKWYLKS